MHIHTYKPILTYTPIYIYTSTHIHIYTHTYKLIHIYIPLYIHTYTHVHTHTHRILLKRERKGKKTKKRSSYRSVSQRTDKMDISHLPMSVVYNYYAAIILFYLFISKILWLLSSFSPVSVLWHCEVTVAGGSPPRCYVPLSPPRLFQL